MSHTHRTRIYSTSKRKHKGLKNRGRLFNELKQTENSYMRNRDYSRLGKIRFLLSKDDYTSAYLQSHSK